MLEILFLYYFGKKIGEAVRAKGHNALGYQIMGIAFWFGGEFAGACLGFGIAGADESAQCIAYIIALIGAAAGAGIAWLIVNNLSPKTPDLPPSSPTGTV
jgi:hypothetical protein